MLDGRPPLPAVTGRDLDRRGLAVQQDGQPREAEALARDPFRGAQRRVGHGLRVADGRGAADREHLGPADRGGLGVERLARRRFGHPAAQPARPAPGDHRGGLPGGHEHHHLTGPVEAAGGVGAGLAGDPPHAVPDLPDDRRLPRVDADALHPAVQPDHEDAPRHDGRQREEHGVADLGAQLEARHVHAVGQPPVTSLWSPETEMVTSRSSELGTMGRSSTVVKTTASSVSVRSVETSVPARSRTVSGCGADSQKSTSAVAADGGKSRMPSRSRKAE